MNCYHCRHFAELLYVRYGVVHILYNARVVGIMVSQVLIEDDLFILDDLFYSRTIGIT